MCYIIHNDNIEVRMSIIFQKDSRSGITYAYENKSWWDKKKKMSRAKRTLVGRLDEKTGGIVATDGRVKKKMKARKDAARKAKKVSPRPGPVPAQETRRLFFGATYLFDQIASATGLKADLQKCFPDSWAQILSIAYFLILEDNNPLYRFEKFDATHRHPFGGNIASARSSELFMSVRDEQVQNFFRLQSLRRIDEEYWAYDTSSISSYSETLLQAQYGKNKENDRLPQINLLLVFGEESGLPFYYRKLAGNIPDSKTVSRFLQQLVSLGFAKSKFVMDRGFCTAANINGLFREHVKFLVGMKLNTKFVRDNLDENIDKIRHHLNYDGGIKTYGLTVPAEWDYEQERPYRRDIVKEKRRIYLHYYFSMEKALEEESAFEDKMCGLLEELKSGNLVEEHKDDYKKFFDYKITPKRGASIEEKMEAVDAARRHFGYFCLASNEKMGAFDALHVYRMKDVVEKAFGNLKERLNMRRLLVSSERSLDGKIFVEFVALILISFLHNKMKKTGLYKTYTQQELLDKLDVIECFEEAGGRLQVGEILEKQKNIYEALEIPVPTSL